MLRPVATSLGAPRYALSHASSSATSTGSQIAPNVPGELLWHSSEGACSHCSRFPLVFVEASRDALATMTVKCPLWRELPFGRKTVREQIQGRSPMQVV
jgi:hypothetical protein